ncbi:MAG: hypothetical protein ACREKA_02520 [Candidatus Methylomirabilales bacterium]
MGTPAFRSATIGLASTEKTAGAKGAAGLCQESQGGMFRIVMVLGIP